VYHLLEELIVILTLSAEKIREQLPVSKGKPQNFHYRISVTLYVDFMNIPKSIN
jgi:hypothetical protein